MNYLKKINNNNKIDVICFIFLSYKEVDVGFKIWFICVQVILCYSFIIAVYFLVVFSVFLGFWKQLQEVEFVFGRRILQIRIIFLVKKFVRLGVIGVVLVFGSFYLNFEV